MQRSVCLSRFLRLLCMPDSSLVPVNARTAKNLSLNRFIKPIYRATADKPVSFSPEGFSIGGRALNNTAAKLRSKTGEPLSHTAYGRYTSGLWAISDYNPDSFDSRYFGAIAEASVRYYAVPFILF
jgi:type IV secretory pathway protease TraF